MASAASSRVANPRRPELMKSRIRWTPAGLVRCTTSTITRALDTGRRRCRHISDPLNLIRALSPSLGESIHTALDGKGEKLARNHLGVALGGDDDGVGEQSPHRANVAAASEQIAGEGVPKHV